MPPTSPPEILLSMDPAAGGMDWTGLILMMVAMGAIMYFMVYRPQQRERAAKESLYAGLSKGDAVVTLGGLHGTVVSVDGEVVRIEVGGKTTVTVDKAAIARKAGEIAPTEKK
jgi:preprotein translocase subunit YajC